MLAATELAVLMEVNITGPCPLSPAISQPFGECQGLQVKKLQS